MQRLNVFTERLEAMDRDALTDAQKASALEVSEILMEGAFDDRTPDFQTRLTAIIDRAEEVFPDSDSEPEAVA
ncbi:MAG: hypothetical protein O3A80_01720 [bacterium]|nr:hypothetical protein [bacterium]MDA1292845.1 hypothetical protein [bacterium]